MLDLTKIEEEISEFWKDNDIEEKLINKGKKPYFLLDGPPYANFIPHIGNIRNTVYKDILIRISIMKGNKVLFQPGFDTHGLPVENMVEKKLNLSSKKDIEQFGIENFMYECKKSATLNKDLWMKVYRKLRSLYYLKEPYITYENYYIDSAWWTFAEMYKKNLVYEGEKPVMWCPRCETSLAGYEVTDSYKDVIDSGVYVLFKLKDSEEHLLVYTTTPWTLPANVAIAVAPKEDYVIVEVSGKKIIIAEKRLPKLSEKEFGYNIITKIKGKDLIEKRYEPLLNVPLQQELQEGKYGLSHKIIGSISLLKERVSSKLRTKKGAKGTDVFEEFVTTDEGTGIVHVAPGHGKTDNIMGQHYGLACVSPLDEHCHFKENAGFSGFVKDADKEIIKKLEEERKLLFMENVSHKYPLCWRCKSPLIFRLSKQLFFKVKNIKEIIRNKTKDVSWYPKFAGERFENWVDNAEDWNISRQRYWGIPIPIWRSDDGEEIVISSSEELESYTNKKIKDLHIVDDILIKKNNKNFKKIKGILDVWFDSGIAPWASLGYPKRNKDLFETHFPVSRINEGQDQIRGWFYSLMFCSSAVFEKQAYNEVSMTGWVLDKKGNKMSKSVGNIISAEDALTKMGSDILRYYFCWDVSPYETQKFNIDIGKKEIGRVLNILWNLQNLVSKPNLNIKDIEDKWLISKLESLTKYYEESMDSFEFQNAFRKITDFILNTLSREYIHMTRDKEKGGIIGHCIVRILTLLAPISIFITESIWQNLRKKNFVKEKSVHLTEWPEFDYSKIDVNLENNFEDVLKIIEKGLSEREKIKIGLKWPLSRVVISFNKKLPNDLLNIISRQLNVKKLEIKKSDKLSLTFDTKLTPKLEAEGFARELIRNVQIARRNKGLKKTDEVCLKISAAELKSIFKKNINLIKEKTNSKKIDFIDDLSNDSYEFFIKSKKIKVEFS